MYLVLAMITAALYWPTLDYGLDKFDEDMILTPNIEYLVKTATIKDVIRRDAFFRSPGKVFYRPVQNISYMIDAKIGRGRPRTFYVSNIILHALASCLVLALLRRLVRSSGVSAFAAVFFCISPLLTQAIAWTPGRGDLLMAVFALASMLTLHGYHHTGRLSWLAGFVLSTVLAVFSKETSAVLVLLLPASLVLRSGMASVVRQRLLLSTGITVACVAALLLLRRVVITDPLAATANSFDVAHLLTNLRVFAEIAAKMVAPPLLQTMSGYTTMATGLGLVVLLGLIGAAWHRGDSQERATVLMGLGWYGAFLLPGAMYVHRFGPAAYDYLEHRGYVPVIGLIVILALLIDRYRDRIGPRVRGLAALVIIGLFTVATVRHVDDFASAMSFYDQAAESNPASALARTNRGQLRIALGDTSGAVEDYTASLQRYPDFLVAHFGLGSVYLLRQQSDSAIVHLRRALDLDPTLSRLAYLLGNAYLNVNTDSSMVWYRYAYERDATNYETAVNLGVLEMRRGNIAAALEVMTQATQRAPNQPITWINLGHIHQKLGMLSEACNDWLRAEQLGDAQAAELRRNNCQ